MFHIPSINTSDDKCWRECGEKGIHSLLMGVKLI